MNILSRNYLNIQKLERCKRRKSLDLFFCKLDSVLADSFRFSDKRVRDQVSAQYLCQETVPN